MRLRRSLSVLVLGAVLAAGLATVATATEPKSPAATLRLESTSIAAGIGVSWGDGKLNFKGKEHAFTLKGLSVADVGISKATATGDVYNLTNVADFAGKYSATEVNFTLAGGSGGIVMQNDKGVVIHARSASVGAQLTLAPSGVSIELK
jgi:hypothetical protein